jgi:lysozyme family protein
VDEQFTKIVKRTLQWEGGFVDSPNDPGGRTNKGITQKEYDSYRTRKGFPTADVLNIADDEVNDIYYNDYFLLVFGNLFESDIRVQWKVFDIGVNMGVNRSLKFVQSIIGSTPDGQFGPKSQSALAEYQMHIYWRDSMMLRLVTFQTRRYHDLVIANPKLTVFLKGWLRRASDTGVGL